MRARTTRLPFDHLAAELAAFPLCSETALKKPFTHLDPRSPETETLWREAERVLLSSSSGISLDELTALRDEIWYGGRMDRPRSLQEHLRRTLEDKLEPLGAGLGPCRPKGHDGPLNRAPNVAEGRQALMWLTFALPEDLLVSTATDQSLCEADLISYPVRNLLSRGFAETHLHFKASLKFSDLWALTVDRLAQAGVEPRDLGAGSACLADGKHLIDWLVRGAVARYLTAVFLASDHKGNFLDFLDRGFRRQAHQLIGPVNYAVLLGAVDDLRRGRLSDDDSDVIRGAYGELARRTVAQVSSLDDVAELDPLNHVLRGTGGAEQRYVRTACTFLDTREGRKDDLLGQVFWQTVRIRTMLYRYVTQRPLTPGLAWFIRFFGRMNDVKGPLADAVMIEAALRRSGADDGLASLEARTGPDDTYGPTLDLIRAAEKSGAENPTVEHAIVIHFAKNRPERGRTPYRTHADPDLEVNPLGYRFSTFFVKQTQKAVSLAEIVHRWPRTQLVLRGLDICSDELAVPTWVMRPLVKHVRKAARSGASYIRSRGGQPLPMLRTTVHAGEDFAHLLTGLRNIHEAIEVLDLREGDRIGHAVALGADPRAWAEDAGQVAMPLEDRVFDLAWEWSWWSKRGAGSDAARLAYVTRELCRLGTRWFGKEMTAHRIETLQIDLTRREALKAAGFPDRTTVPARMDKNIKRLRDFLTDREIFRRGRETLWIETTGEAEALERISMALRDEVSRRGLAIEVNPTSNLLIGDMRDLTSHPLWRLAPPRPRPALPPLAVTVGSDDPLVFNCRLPGEYQLLYDTLVLAGLTDAEALEWLERVRNDGMQRRFSMPLRLESGDVLDVENSGSLAPFPF